MKQYSIAEARSRLPAIVHETERAPVEITRRGRPVAIVLSTMEYRRLSRRSPGLWKALDAFRRRHDLTKLRAEEVFAGTRDRTPGREAKW